MKKIEIEKQIKSVFYQICKYGSNGLDSGKITIWLNNIQDVRYVINKLKLDYSNFKYYSFSKPKKYVTISKTRYDNNPSYLGISFVDNLWKGNPLIYYKVSYKVINDLSDLRSIKIKKIISNIITKNEQNSNHINVC